MKIHALFHDEDGCRELLAEGIYHKADPGGWLDGKRSEPPMEAYIEVTDITNPEGGSEYCEELEVPARAALWEQIETELAEDW